MMLKSMSFPLTVPNRASKGGLDFSLQSPEFTAAYSVKQRKIVLLILLNCKAACLTVFTTMCPQDQRTSDNLIVKSNCFVIEIFDNASLVVSLGDV